MSAKISLPQRIRTWLAQPLRVSDAFSLWNWVPVVIALLMGLGLSVGIVLLVSMKKSAKAEKTQRSRAGQSAQNAAGGNSGHGIVFYTALAVDEQQVNALTQMPGRGEIRCGVDAGGVKYQNICKIAGFKKSAACKLHSGSRQCGHFLYSRL